MEDGLPSLFGGEVDADVGRAGAALIVSGQFDGLALVERSDFTHLFGPAESDDLQRHIDRAFDFGIENRKSRAHLLETQGNGASSLFAIVSEDGEVRRLDFDPLRARGHTHSGQTEYNNERNSEIF